MTSLAEAAATLTTLARSRSGTDRERLVTALAMLCDGSDACTHPPVQAILADLLDAIVLQASPEERVRLAERLATARWAPRASLAALARGPIAAAAPILFGSPVLTDADLEALAGEVDGEHLAEIARRPALSASVVEALLRRADTAALLTLLANAETTLSPEAMAGLTDAADSNIALCVPLAQHPTLTPALAARLHARGGPALRRLLEERFGERVAECGAQAVAADSGAGEAGLVAKLAAAGRLGPGFLLRVLRQGRRAPFELGLALLSGVPRPAIAAACDADSPEALARACESGGIDKSAFPAVLEALRKINAGRQDQAT